MDLGVEEILAVEAVAAMEEELLRVEQMVIQLHSQWRVAVKDEQMFEDPKDTGKKLLFKK